MPNPDLDQTDARLLDILQREFPLVPRPFDALADRLCIATSEVMDRVSRLKRDSVIRQIGAIFDSAALGYSGALVAFKVARAMLDQVAERVSAHDAVSHCYARDADFNLWFTITLPPDSDLDREIAALAGLGGVESHIVLPALKVFKIGVFLDLSCSGRSPSRPDTAERPRSGRSASRPLDDRDRAAIRALQKDLPVMQRPFAELAREAGVGEDELLAEAKAFLETGVMRRYAAVLRHQRAGYRANAMVCWQVEPARIDEAGSALASHPAVSHCYQRAVSPDWPYPLYTMIHCRDDAELERVIAELAASSGLSEFRILRSLKEYKKSRVIYD